MRGQILSRRPLPSTRDVLAEVKRGESCRQIMLKNGLAGTVEGSALVLDSIRPSVPKSSGSTGLGGYGPNWSIARSKRYSYDRSKSIGPDLGIQVPRGT